MRGAIPPLPNTPSWCGDKFEKAQGQLYLYLRNNNDNNNTRRSIKNVELQKNI